MAGEPTASRGAVGAVRRERGQQVGEVGRIAVVGRADGPCERSPGRQGIDDHDRRSVAQARALDAELAHAAGADHDYHIAGGDLAGGADAGERGAAEQRGLGRGQCVSELRTPLAGMTTRSASAPTAVMR